ncbi:MAG: hypothetical protein OHK0012_01080 [Synechococcales cyanobacterium]
MAISSHGFGHATRTIAVINTWRRLRHERGASDFLPIFVTGLPQWLFDRSVVGDFLFRGRALDMGVLQSDSLTMDLPGTQRALAELQDQSAALIRAEADFIRTNRAELVLADIPPLTTAIAHAAGIPCWMVGNFGWDFIYRDFGPDFAEATQWVETLYGDCDRLFRLPMAEAMASFPQRQDIGLTGATPRYPLPLLREKLDLDADRPTVLLTFGGLGLHDLPYDNLRRFPDWQFLSFDADVPELPNVKRLDGKVWRPVDVMPACQALVAKPGYSTFSEAMRVGINVYCITRQGFGEAPLLMEGLERHAHHLILPQEELLQGTWDFLHQPCLPPRDPDPLDGNGNETLAMALDRVWGD